MFPSVVIFEQRHLLIRQAYTRIIGETLTSSPFTPDSRTETAKLGSGGIDGNLERSKQTAIAAICR
jgi:hypothetical protein